MSAEGELATDDSNVVARFVHGIRLYHILIAMGCIVTGEEEAWSRFEGSVESGFCMSFDSRGNCLSMAWSASGLVALVEVAEDHKNDPNGPLSLDGAIARYLGDLPADLQELLTRINSHPYLSRADTASAAFWLSQEHPNLERLDDTRLRTLRGFLYPPEVAIQGDGARWEGWARIIYMTRASMEYGSKFEKASRHTPYELSHEEAEVLIPAEFFGEVPDPGKLSIAVRPTAESITSENVALTVDMLHQVGIRWTSAAEIAASRGVRVEDDLE